ncbi:ribonuclease H-like protein, partial [Ramaria rubella]
VYTNGSCIYGKVGAAAVLIKDRHRKCTLQKHLGKEENYTVFKAELIGLYLGTKLLSFENCQDKATMGADSQAALRAMQNNRSSSGKYIVDTLHEVMLKLMRRQNGLELTLCWVPGHMEVKGNEIADAEAKAAAQGNSSPSRSLPQSGRGEIPFRKSALIQA